MVSTLACEAPNPCPIGRYDPGPPRACVLPDGGRIGIADAGAPLDAQSPLVGTWEGCEERVTFAAGGELLLEDVTQDCTLTGTWEATGSMVHLSYDVASTCSDWAGVDVSAEFIVSGDGLILVQPGSGESARYAAPGTPVERWRGEATEEPGGTPGTTVFRIVGTVGVGFGTGCYWSLGGCPGVISCGGPVTSWSRTSDTFRADVECGGSCPCMGTIDGTPAMDGTIPGTFEVSTCARRFGGSITLRLDE